MFFCGFIGGRTRPSPRSKAAIAANPNFADGFNAKGIVLHYIGRNEAALASFAQADALDPASPDVWLYCRAQALYQLGRWAEAAALLERRIALNPETDISRVLLAACYGQMGRSEDARETWDAALRANPAYSFRERLKTLRTKSGRRRPGRRWASKSRRRGLAAARRAPPRSSQEPKPGSDGARLLAAYRSARPA